MDAKPKIFISTVTKELQSARKVVTDTLRRLHFEPVVQDEFPSHTVVVRSMLEKELEPCAAVIQIVGFRYGWDVYGAPDPTEVMSYTHYEAQYAHRKPIPIWYLLITDKYETDQPNDEDAEKKAMQAAYRVRVQRTGHLYHFVEDIKDLELAIFRMSDDLDKLRPERFQHLPLLDSEIGNPARPQPQPVAPVTDAIQLEKTLRALLSEFVPALQQAQQGTSAADEERKEQELYDRLATMLEVTPDEARTQIQSLAEKAKANPAERPLERAKAAYALKNYPEAEDLALQAATEAAGATPSDTSTQRSALCQAGGAAREQLLYKRALDYYRAAAVLTSEEHDVLEWAGIQNKIGWLLCLDGQNDAHAILMHRVWLNCEKAGHPEHPISLHSHNLWALALDNQGDHARAEDEHRAVLTIRVRVLGPEHPDSLASRNNLGGTLQFQGKSTEAEQEHRAVLAIQERVLGKEHPSTLACRNNIASALGSQGKHAESENENRAVLAIRKRVYGTEHPDTLANRNNLANSLRIQGKYAEAENEHRAVLIVRESVLGPDHPDILASRHNLANTLYPQGKHVEAEKEHRDVLAIRERVLGSELPEVFRSCYNLSLCLEVQGKKEDALEFARRSMVGRTKVLMEDHPDTLDAKWQVEHLEAESSRLGGLG